MLKTIGGNPHFSSLPIRGKIRCVLRFGQKHFGQAWLSFVIAVFLVQLAFEGSATVRAPVNQVKHFNISLPN
jgi:hypothetical protein